MDPLKILIADSDQNFSNMLKRRLSFDQDMEIIGATNNGWELLHLIRERTPDILIINLALRNGLELLPCTQLIEKPPKILAFSSGKSGASVPLSSKLEINFFSQIDSQMGDLLSCMKEMAMPAGGTRSASTDSRVSALLRQFGIPPYIIGYQYLRSAIRIAMNDPHVLDAVTKILYPDIAARYGTSAACVERAMRNAIQVAWRRGDAALQTYFKYNVKPRKGRPTNAEFIATMVDILSLQQRHSGPAALI